MKMIYYPLVYLISLFFLLSMQAISAESPSFVRQEVTDKRNDWINFTAGSQEWLDIKNTDRMNVSLGDPLIDISRVYYKSNGKFLYASFWLFPQTQFQNNFSAPDKNIMYGVLIDADSNLATGRNGIDYKITIRPTNVSDSWITLVEELETPDPLNTTSGGKKELLTKTYNSKSAGNRSIDLSVDLDLIASPDRYDIIFYAAKEVGNNIWNVDFSRRVTLPTPEITLISTPSAIELREGKNEPVSLQLKSAYNFFGIYNYMIQEKNKIISGATFDFDVQPNIAEVSPIDFTIEIARGAKPGTYTIPIIANYSTTSSFPFLFVSSLSDAKNLTKAFVFDKSSVVKEMPLSISIVKALSFQEQLSNFNEQWITPLNGIYAFIGGSVIAVVSYGYQRYNEKHGTKPATINLRKWAEWYIPTGLRAALILLIFVYFGPKFLDTNIISPETIKSVDVGRIIAFFQIVTLIFISLGYYTRLAAIFLIFGLVLSFFTSINFNAVIESLTLVISVFLLVMGPGRISIEFELLKREKFPVQKDYHIITQNRQMHVTLTIGSNNPQPPQTQSITIAVRDDTFANVNLVGAFVSGEIIDPKGVSRKLDTDVTDDKGTLTYYWDIKRNSAAGQYTVNVYVSAGRYKSGSSTGTYTV